MSVPKTLSGRSPLKTKESHKTAREQRRTYLDCGVSGTHIYLGLQIIAVRRILRAFNFEFGGFRLGAQAATSCFAALKQASQRTDLESAGLLIMRLESRSFTQARSAVNETEFAFIR